MKCTSMSRNEYRANGKLMISGEYFVLDGAQSLAVPTKFGQSLVVDERKDDEIHWVSKDLNGVPWFEATFQLDQSVGSHVHPVEDRLIHILSVAREMNADFLSNGADVEIQVDFDLQWGLGSSSTLISLVAQWANVDPYELQFSCFGGSGYDIACATANGPILYERLPKPHTETIDFSPPFLDQLFFVYLGKKQNSRDGINHYRKLDIDKKDIICELNHITQSLIQCRDLRNFEELLTEHELIVSNALRLERVQELHFGNYWGSCKSLGAWGGDFILATSDRTEKETRSYFSEIGYTVCLSYRDMVR